MKDLKLMLEKYRELENAIRESDEIKIGEGESPMIAFENYLVNNNRTSDSDKLKLIRNIRNFCSHNDEGISFAGKFNKQLLFIESCISYLDSFNKKVKDKTMRYPAVKETDTVKTLIDELAKRKKDFVPVTDANSVYLYTLSSKDVIKIASESKLPGKQSIKSLIKAVKTESNMKTYINDQNYEFGMEGIVVNKLGKYLGIVGEK